MKIAVTYDNGRVFQHFGETKNFAIYEINDGNMMSREVRSTNGLGHVQLIGLLQDWGINVLICGGLGTHAVFKLKEAGIEIFPGCDGDTELLVKDYLNGNLKFNMDAVHECHH